MASISALRSAPAAGGGAVTTTSATTRLGRAATARTAGAACTSAGAASAGTGAANASSGAMGAVGAVGDGEGDPAWWVAAHGRPLTMALSPEKEDSTVRRKVACVSAMVLR